MSNYLKGILLVAVACLAWGGLATSVQYLVQNQSVYPEELSSFRLLASGLLMTIVCCLFKVKNCYAIFKNFQNAWQIALSGVIVCFAHLSFFMSIYYSNAGTGAIFLATQPLLAAIYVCLIKKEALSKRILLCLALAFFGVVLIVTDGDLTTLHFSPACIVWGTFSALFATAYSIEPKAAVNRLGSTTVLSWGLLVGGIIGVCINPPIHLVQNLNMPVLANLAFIVLVATIFAFWCYLTSFKYISPVLVGLVVTLEPLSAFVFSIILLHESVGLFQAIGIASIISTVVILSTAKQNT